MTFLGRSGIKGTSAKERKGRVGGLRLFAGLEQVRLTDSAGKEEERAWQAEAMSRK